MSTAASSTRNDYEGDGSTASYAITFPYAQGEQLEVTTLLAGFETSLALTSGYTLAQTFTANQMASGGTLTLVAGVLATGTSLHIRRKMDILQPISPTSHGSFSTLAAVAALDKGVRIAQQQQEEIGRSLHLPMSEAGTANLTELPADRASKYLAFDADKNLVAADDLPIATLNTVSVPNGSAAMLASVDSTDYKAISWDVYLVHTDGRRYQSRIDAHLNTAGTDADYSERGTDDVGDWTGTITADLDSGNIRLLVEGTELNWTGYAVRNFMRA